MFESAELGQTLPKTAYQQAVPKLRTELLAAQKKLAASNAALLLIIGGVEGAGKTELANTLMEWIDPRGVQVHALGEPNDEERLRPRFWRFWRILPPKKSMAMFLTSWYTQPIVDRVFKTQSKQSFAAEVDRIKEFETMLSNEGVIIVKLWLHLSKDRQKNRLKKLEKDPETRWRVTKQDWKFFAKYDRFRAVSETALMKTHSPRAPWNIIEATDKRYRTVAAAKIILNALSSRLADAPPAAPAAKPQLPTPAKMNIIRKLDMALKLDDAKYKTELEKYQAQLSLLSRKLRDSGRAMLLVFEGPDAAGKGGAIRRLTQAMDARSYRIISTAAPTDEERAHPYLWRFWRNIPKRGDITVNDRSWYGRVLVERIEGFCKAEEWKRAYNEINSFEEELGAAGAVIIKFWLAITPQEQLRRFKDRQLTPYKQYKLTEEDWRNRAKWNAYEAAACDMMEKTSTPNAPWVPVEANDKNWARIKIIKTVCGRLRLEL